MQPQPDLDPAGVALVNVLGGVHREHLTKPTPCRDWTVGQLLAHIDGLTQAFTAAAAKDLGPLTDNAPRTPDAEPSAGWATRIPRQVEALVRAWHRSEAWEGSTRAGGVDLPGEAAGLVALDELVLHGWDLARATGQAYEVDQASARAVLTFVRESQGGQDGIFGPPLEVPQDADTFDQALRLAGRDPGWEP